MTQSVGQRKGLVTLGGGAPPVYRSAMLEARRAGWIGSVVLLASACSAMKTPDATPGAPSGAGAAGDGAAGSAAAGSTSLGAENRSSGDEAAGSAAAGSISLGGADASSGGVPGSGAAGGTSLGAASPDWGEPAAPDACANALLCESFEAYADGAVPGAPWAVSENNGAVRVSSERAFGGTTSLHCTGNAGQFAQAYISTSGAPLFPAAGSGMYGRMMLWVRDNPVGSIHWTFVSAEGRSAADDYTAFYRVGGQVDGRLLANYWTEGNATDCWDHSSALMPVGDAGGWTCLEWHYETANDELEFWLNGQALDDMHITGTGEGCIAHDLNDVWEAPAAFDVLRLGWEHVAMTNQRDVWLDDIAVGTTRIGCPGPR